MYALRWSVFGLLLLVATAGWGQLRQEVNLGGDWEFVMVKDLADGPPADGWKPFAVPGHLYTGAWYQRAWFRHDFEVPQSMGGSRIVLHFGGIKWNSVVRVNGQQVGGHFGGFEPFEVDITGIAKLGGTNRLEVGCCDWTGVFNDHKTEFPSGGDGMGQVKDEVLAPSSISWWWGIWDQVTLRARPSVYVKDLFIKPSVRKQSLRVEYVLGNDGDAAVTVALLSSVEDAGQTSLRFPEQTITIPAGGTASAVVEAPWQNAHRWSTEDPYLYFLSTQLDQNGKSLDALRTRFGFREFWIEGKDYILNGSRIHLFGTSWFPELYGKKYCTRDKDYIRQRLLAAKAANCVILRTQTQPWPELWYETADEVGLLMIPEGAVYGDYHDYRVNDPRFWDNFAAHLKAEVDRDKNKPSVVMYSIENEFFFLSNQDLAEPVTKGLARMGQFMHQWDPTRPIYYEADGDPMGVADAISLHYPHERPDFNQWPNTAYWLDQPLHYNLLVPTAQAQHDWLWDRQKPLYIGEFGWAPSSDPSPHTVFCGDEAYLDHRHFRAKAKADAWRMWIQAYRQCEVSGIAPWSMNEESADLFEASLLDEAHNPPYAAQKYATQHLAAYVREYDHNFYAREKVTRTADVYNDILSPSTLTVEWALLGSDNAVLQQDETNLTMQPGERRELQFTLRMPPATTRRELTLQLKIRREGKQVFEDTKSWSVFPALSLKSPETVALYDPQGRTRQALASHGLNTITVNDLSHIPAGVKMLVVGAGATGSGTGGVPVIGGADHANPLLAFARKGGRVLVLEQEGDPQGILPVSAGNRASTMTFAQMPQHPLLKGLAPLDLKWWRPDNLVSVNEPPRPGGGFRAVVTAGSDKGVAYAPLLESPVGQGVLVLSQLRISERLGVEPAAGILLQNALDYLAAYEPDTPRTALYCPTSATRSFLDGIGLLATDITADPSKADWQAMQLLIACGPLGGLGSYGDQIAELLRRGGTVLLHGLRPQDFAALSPIVGTDLILAPSHGPVKKLPVASPLSECLTNEDLYWLGKRASLCWVASALATNTTDFALSAAPGRTLPEGVTFLTSPAALAVMQRGAGRIVLDSINWDSTSDNTLKATRYCAGLLTGLGAQFRTSGAVIQANSLPHDPTMYWYRVDPDAAYLGDKGYISARIRCLDAGRYAFQIVARGTPLKGVYPVVEMSVDGKVVGQVETKSDGWWAFPLTVDMAEGTHEIRFAYINDEYQPPENRDLWISRIEIAAEQ
ncbi:MAG: glycoside hydrolase family 2 TIM barrel-domain containing protein [Armatimonadia bacterium]